MKRVFVFFMCLVLGTQLVRADGSIDPKTDLKNAIAVLLENPTIPLDNSETTALLTFTLNKKGELVVLDVDCANEFVTNYVKSRLNYQKLDIEMAAYGTPYTIQLRILKDSYALR